VSGTTLNDESMMTDARGKPVPVLPISTQDKRSARLRAKVQWRASLSRSFCRFQSNPTSVSEALPPRGCRPVSFNRILILDPAAHTYPFPTYLFSYIGQKKKNNKTVTDLAFNGNLKGYGADIR
jgi:hypothetical protein